MKKIILSLLLFAFCKVNAQQNFCGKPDPNFCPGNIFTNGNFETVTANPDATGDQDINVATGWSPIWQGGSLADLYCAGSSGVTQRPTPSSGVYASLWICNRNLPDAIYREGMFNKLQTTIAGNSGSYSFNFNTAKLSDGQSAAVEIGIYGVSFTSSLLPSAPTGMSVPTNLNLFGAGNAVLLGTVTVPANTTNTWANQTISFNSGMAGFPAAGINHILITKSDNVLPGLAQMYMAFDNFCLRVSTSTPESFCGCANTTNLIKNGNFNNGIQDFTSKFTQMTNSFVPGTYTVVDGDGGRALCGNWLNGSGCGKDGQLISKFLAVNGKTGQQGILTAWGQSVTVETGREYKLCFNLGNLRQCCFNVDPKVTILYNDGVQQKTIGPITVSSNNSPCNWLNYSTVIVIPPGASPTINLPINIALDQSGLGDGNDLAIDDISLIKLNPLPNTVTDFGENISSVDANGKYTITATASALPAGTGFYWEIQDITDPANPKILTNPSQWWGNPLSTNFNGYDNGTINNASIPGIFIANRTYRIVRGTWGDCNSWGAVSHIYRKEINGNRIIAQRDNSYVAPNKNFSSKTN
jgi:hypothetical protein